MTTGAGLAAIVTALAIGCDGGEWPGRPPADDSAGDDEEWPYPMCDQPGLVATELEVAWQRPIGQFQAYGTPYGSSLAFDSQGAIILDGTVEHFEGLYCPSLIKLAPDGEVVWTRRYDFRQPPDPASRPCPRQWEEVKVDGEGSILAIGDVPPGDDDYGPSDIAVRKVDGGGRLAWTYHHRSELERAWDRGSDIAVTPDGEVIAGGGCRTAGCPTRSGTPTTCSRSTSTVQWS